MALGLLLWVCPLCATPHVLPAATLSVLPGLIPLSWFVAVPIAFSVADGPRRLSPKLIGQGFALGAASWLACLLIWTEALLSARPTLDALTWSTLTGIPIDQFFTPPPGLTDVSQFQPTVADYVAAWPAALASLLSAGIAGIVGALPRIGSVK